MADPVIIGAAVGWGLSIVGWLASPIISRVLNKGFVLLDFDAAKKLTKLDVQVLQLQRLMEVVDESNRALLEPLLDQLKSAFYEAEDILDAVEYQRLKKQILDGKSQDHSEMDLPKKNVRSAMASSSLRSPPVNPVPKTIGGGWSGLRGVLTCKGINRSQFPSIPVKLHQTRVDKESGMSKVDLKTSLEKIESAITDACEILKQLDLPGVSNDKGRRALATNSRSAVTTADPPSRVIGRDQDRDKIISMLHEKEDQCEENTISATCYSVIGIHGMAGSGKSTLAQCVYDHEKKCKQQELEDHFDIVMWIHVSEKFDLYSIFREMFEGATWNDCPKFSSLNVLKENLQEKLCGKRIFLVLDDVWYNSRNARDHEELRQILTPLDVGKAGSKILVTSRTEDALLAMGSVKETCIPISDLDDQLFLELFMYYALGDARLGGHDRRKLETIGEDIAKKLKRSPLAARIVGARLRNNPKVEIWMREKDRDLMKETMGALWWSYQYLDEQVRRCFAYCSIFPRRHRLARDELVKLWVAEGFIKTSMAKVEMEDVAQDYFNELLSASFLQLGGKQRVDGCEVDYFTIHDLLCDLAEEVAGGDCFRIEKDFTGEVPPGVRYLFFGTYNRDILTNKISGLQNLRTLIIDDIIWVKSDYYEVLVSMFTMLTVLRKLRVLNMRVACKGGFGFSFSFPDSIGQLKHLRYFSFMVPVLHKLTVPRAFTKLYHMQVVNFGSSKILEFSSGEDMMNLINLRCIISWADLDFPNVGRLTWLQMLPFFTISNKQGYESHQLKHLNKLQGKLQIHGLGNVRSKGEAVEMNLAGKEKLTELILSWDHEACSPLVQAEVLEGLCPSKYLKILEIRKYKSMRLPYWMTGKHNGGPKNLHTLRVSNWSQQGPAPDFGAFTHLHSLVLGWCSWDTLPGNMDHPASLKKLEIRSCKNMLSLPTLPKSLEEFNVIECSREAWDALPGNMEHLTSLRKLKIESCQNIQPFPTLPKSLEEFGVEDCTWDALPGNMEHLTTLKKLELVSCKNIRSLPTLPKSLEEITVKWCSHEFVRSCRTAGHPNWQKTEHIQNKSFN